MHGHKWTETEKCWLTWYIPDHKESEIIEAFRERFGWTMSRSQYKNIRHFIGVKSGTHGGCFQKGQTAWNKGRKMEIKGRMTETMFKAGNMPHNHCDIGTEIVDSYGYQKVKIAEPNKWAFKHRIVWEKHNGRIPKGKIIVFIDGNKRNIDIDNLMVLSRAELVRANQERVWELPMEFRKTALLAVKLKNVIRLKKGK